MYYTALIIFIQEQDWEHWLIKMREFFCGKHSFPWKKYNPSPEDRGLKSNSSRAWGR